MQILTNQQQILDGHDTSSAEIPYLDSHWSHSDRIIYKPEDGDSSGYRATIASSLQLCQAREYEFLTIAVGITQRISEIETLLNLPLARPQV